MIITKKVQFLSLTKNENGLISYDFLDLESNLPFSVYSTSDVISFKDLKEYVPTDVRFKLVYCKTLNKNGGYVFAWKLKPVD